MDGETSTNRCIDNDDWDFSDRNGSDEESLESVHSLKANLQNLLMFWKERMREIRVQIDYKVCFE